MMPSAATKSKSGKFYILTRPSPWHVMSVNYEQPFDELTVQVWLFYDHPNFKHVQVGRNYGQTDWKTDGRTDDPINRCSRHIFQAGGIERRLPPWVLQSAILPIQMQIQVNYTKMITFVTPHIGYFWRMFWRKDSNWIFTSIFSWLKMAMVRITSVNGTYNRRFDLHMVRITNTQLIALWNQTYNEKTDKDNLINSRAPIQNCTPTSKWYK